MIFGKYEEKEIDANKLVVLPQVRKQKNDKEDALVESIQKNGLLNLIDVARLTEAQLVRHLDFINEIWKTDIEVDESKKVNGYYYVVISGHTRLKAVKKIADKKKCIINVKIHKAKTSIEIIRIQLDENIHSEPKSEERAIAIIETFQAGLKNGEWEDKADFILKNKKFLSKSILNDALAFSNLPSDIQKYVFENNIPYTTGVEFGRMYPLVVKYESDLLAKGESLEINLKYKGAIIAGELLQAKSIKRGLQILKGYIKTIEDHFKPSEEVQQMMLLEWENGVDIQTGQHLSKLQKDYRRVMQGLTDKSFEKLNTYFNLNEQLTGEDHNPEKSHILKLQNTYHKEINKR